MTTFFELIDISATHIYHSALELSPLSSIIRKFYYYQRPHSSPRVVIGTPDSWNPSTAIATKNSHYLTSTWSPCSQFIAAVAGGVMEIRDPLTLELLSTLQPTKATPRFRRGLAYSPDGYSLAGCADTVIVIWDIQTGGVVKEIECGVTDNGLDLVWSLDGKTICTTSPQMLETLTVHIYDVASGMTLSSNTLQSRDKPYLWAHNLTFQIATTTAWEHKGRKINIFEAGPTFTKIKSFPFKFHSSLGAFSPATYQISVSIAGSKFHNPELLILNIGDSEALLHETGDYWHHSFSLDGSIFGAFTRDHLFIWRYTSTHYTQWRKFQQDPMSVQFSPTLSSILGYAGALLHVLHLDSPPAAPTTKSAITIHGTPRDAYSPHSTYIATTYCGESTITIINLSSQNPSPSQFIDTDLKISEIVLTGNVLLAKGPDTVVAWLLTEEGVVDGVFGNRRADHNDSLWATSSHDTHPQAMSSRDESPSFWARLLQRDHSKHNSNGDLVFSVQDEIATIGHRTGFNIHSYHTGTGEILKQNETPLHLEQIQYRFNNPHRDDCNLYHHDLLKHHKPVESNWPVSQTTLQEGWIKDPEGRHRLWLHAHWRLAGNDVEWLNKVTTLRLKNSSELVIIKF